MLTPILHLKLADSGGLPKRPGAIFPPLIPVKTPDTLPFVNYTPKNPLRPILFTLTLKSLPALGLPAPVPIKPPSNQPFVDYTPTSPLKSILFKLASNKPAGSPQPWFPLSIPRPPTRLSISGITKDSSGVALGSCLVSLFRTSDNALIAQTTSDVNGNYQILIASSGAHYIVAYKAGSPDVAGTTVNTLVGL
jgi:hypothetical protein